MVNLYKMLIKRKTLILSRCNNMNNNADFDHPMCILNPFFVLPSEKKV
jgi:hypothetical protein